MTRRSRRRCRVDISVCREVSWSRKSQRKGRGRPRTPLAWRVARGGPGRRRLVRTTCRGRSTSPSCAPRGSSEPGSRATPSWSPARSSAATSCASADREAVTGASLASSRPKRTAAPRNLASHARAGLTRRTRALFGPEGHAYVFFVYGMHECFNVTCAGAGRGHAVLVRAGEPTLGLDEHARLDGPGRFARAMGLSRVHDGHNLTEPPIFLFCGRTSRPRIAVTPRVGVGYAGASGRSSMAILRSVQPACVEAPAQSDRARPLKAQCRSVMPCSRTTIALTEQHCR